MGLGNRYTLGMNSKTKRNYLKDLSIKERLASFGLLENFELAMDSDNLIKIKILLQKVSVPQDKIDMILQVLHRGELPEELS